MTRLTRLTGTLVLGAFAGVTTLAFTPAQTPPPATGVQPAAHQEHVHPATGPQTEMQKQEEPLMQMHQKMMADMKMMDDRLNELVATMDAATGEAKVSAMAALVASLVQQRKPMREGMMQMQGQMMGHMMQHMSDGGPEAMKSMMASCPMMKMMGGGGQ